jgi:ABC-type Fe3+ transport system substrate-binding protein
VEAGTVFVPTSIRIERLMAVGGIGWGQAVSGLYARGHGSCDVEGKLEIVWSPVDETPIFALTGGHLKDAPHPNAAKLYLTWFLAREQQSRLGSFVARRRAAA